MSNQTTRSTNAINDILEAYLFQVVGSTPESIRDAIKVSALKANPGPAGMLAASAMFASAVNKTTMENFISKPEMSDARPIISTTFSISGRPNMTGLTLLGHCLLTTDFSDSIKFCQEFKKKMGQNDVWAGNLDSGSLSDKQKDILKEKKRVTSYNSAKMLGSGFLKFTKISLVPYTTEEADFWGESNPLLGQSRRYDDGYDAAQTSTPRSKSVMQDISPPRRVFNTTTKNVILSDKSVATIPTNVYDYYMATHNNDLSALTASLEKRTTEEWVSLYSDAMLKDPERRGFQGGTALGR
jgi:hypothetical protein